MARYISKDALVAEIERLREEKSTFYASDVLYNLEDFINTLEVKEVDLEREIKEKYLQRRWYGGKKNMLVIQNEPEFTLFAKHFFELGLKAQKGEKV